MAEKDDKKKDKEQADKVLASIRKAAAEYLKREKERGVKENGNGS